MLVTVLLLGFVLVAAVTDLARHKIYNWTTYSGIVTAALWNFGVGFWLWRADDPDNKLYYQFTNLGYIHPLDCVLGFVFCGFVMLFCFVMLAGIGGGDVKLVAMMGAFLGLDQGIITMLWTFILAACLAVIVLIWRVGALRLLSILFRRLLYALRIYPLSPLNEEETKQLQAPLFLAPSAVAAVVIVRFGLVPIPM